jgi:tryptophan-rich sensory protein
MSTVSLRQGWPLLLVFLGIVLGIGIVVGLIATPGGYVQQLKVPDFVLPETVSSALWLVLSAAFAVVGWRNWVVDSNSTDMRLWLATLILSWWFSPAFFIMRSPTLALVISTIMFVLMVWFTLRAWRRDRVSFWLYVPSVVYLGYIAAMTAAIVAMN